MLVAWEFEVEAEPRDATRCTRDHEEAEVWLRDGRLPSCARRVNSHPFCDGQETRTRKLRLSFGFWNQIFSDVFCYRVKYSVRVHRRLLPDPGRLFPAHHTQASTDASFSGLL